MSATATTKSHRPLREIVAATHTPFHPDGSLNPGVIPLQAERLHADGLRAAFIGGTTGESASLTLEERKTLTKEWVAAARPAGLRVVVHVGSNSLEDARTLAAHAETSGADAISAVGPSYFKLRDVASLVEWCATIAKAAPSLPFYCYDIPSMTGTNLDVAEFLDRGAQSIPNLAGLKFSNLDLALFQRCLRAAQGRMEVLFGSDEQLLSALALGGVGAVGSTYNFTAPTVLRMLDAWHRGDHDSARRLQFRIVEWVRTLSRFGYMAAARQVMEFRGVPLGPPRLPHSRLSPADIEKLRQEVVPWIAGESSSH